MTISFEKHCAGAIPRRRHCRSASSRSTADHHHIGFLTNADFPRRFIDRFMVCRLFRNIASCCENSAFKRHALGAVPLPEALTLIPHSDQRIP
jgi:hypothetical protein